MKKEYISAIRQMFNGKRGNSESLQGSKAYYEQLDIVVEKDELMREKLKDTPELLKLYEETTFAIDDYHGIGGDDCFGEGFRFGVLMGLDVAGLIKDE